MKYVKTIQGTDGVRGLITENAPGHPLFDFISDGLVSPAFFNFYAYVLCKYLIMIKEAEERTVVIATDNRDPSGAFIDSACKGCAAAGFDVINAGMLPTPAVPLLMSHYAADAGIMLTASHNPASYHGIKIFMGPDGLKLTPDQEAELTNLMYHLAEFEVSDMFDSVITSNHEEAQKVFVDFHKNYLAAILKESTPLEVHVDCANGAFSDVAEKILTASFFGSVHIVNQSLSAEINTLGGAVPFEGLDVISAKLLRSMPSLKKIAIIKNMFAAGKKANTIIVGLVFDGDGDRFVGLLYNPFDKCIHVYTGDKAVALIIRSQEVLEPKPFKLFTTIESDPLVTDVLPAGSHSTDIAPVGDRWLGFRIRDFLAEPYSEGQTVIGYEDSGHILFPVTDTNREKKMICGNGMIGGIHFIKALVDFRDRFTEETITNVLQPYQAGIKQSVSIYGTDKSRLKIGEAERIYLDQFIDDIAKKLKKKGFAAGKRFFPEEPNMIYFEVGNSKDRGVLFIRNSGTEAKTSVCIRGDYQMLTLLEEIRDSVLVYLHKHLKDCFSPENRPVFLLLKTLFEDADTEKKPVAEDVALPDEHLNRLADKEKLISFTKSGEIVLTELGMLLAADLAAEYQKTAAEESGQHEAEYAATVASETHAPHEPVSDRSDDSLDL